MPIDVSAGSSQEYVEDCPVCCRPNVIHIEVDEDGDVRVWASAAHRRHRSHRLGSQSAVRCGRGLRRNAAR